MGKEFPEKKQMRIPPQRKNLFIKMQYHELTIHVSDDAREAVIGKLSALGTLGFVENDKSIIAYFDDKKDVRNIYNELHKFKSVLKASGLDPYISLESSTLPDKDWNEEWKKNFSPIEVGETIVIVPSWLNHETERTIITIDPGRAFGTGYHETTLRCLEILEKYACSYQGNSLLDIGTGTGILAIGALKLGFGRAECVDTDPLAVEAAMYNAELNDLKNINIRQGDISAAAGQFSFITANLLADILTGIAHDIASSLTIGGTALLSGMLIGQEDSVINAMKQEGLMLKEKFVDNKWVTLTMHSPS